MTNRRQRRGARVLGGAHLAQGGILLAQRPAVLRAVVGDQDVPPSWIVQVLGARTLVQGIAECWRPRRDVVCVGAAVDLAHAVTMVAAARLWPRYRRAALTSAGSAAASALVGAILTGTWP